MGNTVHSKQRLSGNCFIPYNTRLKTQWLGELNKLSGRINEKNQGIIGHELMKLSAREHLQYVVAVIYVPGIEH